MPDTVWKKIAEDYAIYCECTRPLDMTKEEWPGWEANHLRMLNGTTHLWQAYIAAAQAEEKDHLLYARILFSIYRECTAQCDSHEALRFYVAPGWEQVQLAIAEGQHPTERELDFYRSTFEELSYVVKCEDGSDEEIKKAYMLVEGLEQYPDFSFHDSKPVHFEHTEHSAELTLEYDDLRLCLEFTDIYEIHVEGDPSTNWIEEFYCYCAFRNQECVCFDVGYYRIWCKGIRVKSALRTRINGESENIHD